MTINIEGQVFASLAINGALYPLAATPGAQLYQIQNTKHHVPSMKILIDDVMQVLDSTTPLNDGTKITVISHDGTNATPPAVNYRVFGTPKRYPSKTTPGCFSYEVVGIFDNPTYLRSRPSSSFVGSSSSIMQQIAQNVGLKLVSNANTTDSMTWLPGTRSWANFANHLARHGFEDVKSAITCGVDESSNLYHHNVTKLFTTNEVVGYIYYGGLNQNDNTNKKFLALQAKGVNRSGLHNYWSGYTMETNQISMKGMPVTQSAVTATTVNNELDLALDVKAQLNLKGRLAFAPADCNNAHPAYIQARHQNFRLINTYNQNVYVLIGAFTGFKLFDLIYFSAENGGDQLNSSLDGIYCITAINRMVHGSRYYEKQELTNAGPSNTNSNL